MKSRNELEGVESGYSKKSLLPRVSFTIDTGSIVISD